MLLGFEQLKKSTDADLIKEHDKIAKSTVPGVNYYLDELFRRNQNKQTEKMLSYTKRIFYFTAVVTIATIVNVVIFFCSLYN